jgi:hypothetical protein
MKLRNVYFNADGNGAGSSDVVPKSEYEKAVERSRKFEAQLTDTEKRLKSLEGIDPERVKAEREELDILRKQGVGNDPKKLDELLERTRKETEDKLSKRFGDKLTEFEKQNGELSKELKHIRVTKSALDVAAKMFLPEAIKFVEPIINASCDWVEGKIVVKDEKGEPRYSKKNPKEPMGVEELLGEVAESNPFLVPASTRKGTDNGAQKTGATAQAKALPSDFNGWPIERQQEFFRDNPELRTALLAQSRQQ